MIDNDGKRDFFRSLDIEKANCRQALKIRQDVIEYIITAL